MHLETTALREPDDVTVTPRLAADGSRLPATLFRLAREALARDRTAGGPGESNVYERVAGRLYELIHEVREIDIDHDDKRGLLTLIATDDRGTKFAARDLSDGTLRFLALAVLEIDPDRQGLICFEEPENGIHPRRIPAILQLLQDIAVDTQYPLGPDNPLLQIIINTHSPGVIGYIDKNDLIYADKQVYRGAGGAWLEEVKFLPHSKSWRELASQKSGVALARKTAAAGKIKAYLCPVRPQSEGNGRVVDQPEYRDLFSDLETEP